MDNLVIGLKTMMVFLNSLSLQTDITFDPLIIDWFNRGKKRFNILLNGRKVGYIAYQYKMNQELYFGTQKVYSKKMSGKINLNNPYDLDYVIEIDSLLEDAIINGKFNIRFDKENRAYSTFTALKEVYKNYIDYHKSNEKIDVSLGIDSLYSAKITDKFGTEQLLLFPFNSDTTFLYNYISKDLNHLTEFSALIKDEQFKINSVPIFKYVMQKSYKFIDLVLKDEQFMQHSNTKIDINNIVSLMHKIYPYYQKTIKKVAQSLESDISYGYWFNNLLSLCIHNMEKQDIKTLFGIESKDVILDGNKKSLTDLYTATMHRSREKTP